MQAQSTAAPKRKRGRPPGAKDAAPRARRSKQEIAAGQQAAAAVPKKLKEGQIQSLFIKWLAGVPAPGRPGRKLGDYTFAIPNGIWIPGDLQTRIRIIMNMRRQGMKKGIPDVTIALPLHNYCGAFIELKRDPKQVQPSNIAPEQRDWLTRLREVGYLVEMAVGLSNACAAVGRYMQGQAPEPFPWEKVSADSPTN